MTRSGCSQGSPVPADTPQKNVRSPRVTVRELEDRLYEAMNAANEYHMNFEYAVLASSAQLVADTARALAEREET